MTSPEDDDAWLEGPGRRRLELQMNCSIGRATGNDIVVDSTRASRRHAVVHLQNIGEFWLVDLGSTNGTYLNARRIPQPVRLTHDDEIMIGETVFKFHQPHRISQDYQTKVLEATIRGVEHVGCWLLLVDVEDFTPLSSQLHIEELAVILGNWLSACKQIVEERGGSINKYLGDGILAYWRGSDASVRQITDTIQALKELQRRENPKFRIVIHFGPVAVGGLVSMGEESLMGKEVNLVFRLEKLAGSLRAPATISASAKSKLGDLIGTRSLGEHCLKGFNDTYELFAI
jgi:class 3 adenylate cyclase